MKWPEILHADVSWPLTELIRLWLQFVDFSNFEAILTKWNGENLGFPGIFGFSSLRWPFGWNWSYLGFLGIIWRTCGSKCRGEGGGIFLTLCVECCLVCSTSCVFMMSWHGSKCIYITGPLWGESPGHLWGESICQLCEGKPPVTGRFSLASQRASNVELWYFFCCQPKQAVDQLGQFSVNILKIFSRVWVCNFTIFWICQELQVLVIFCPGLCQENTKGSSVKLHFDYGKTIFITFWKRINFCI